MGKTPQKLEDLLNVKARWQRWGRMHEIYLPEAIALSFNVEPSDDLIEFGDWTSGRRDHRFRDEAMQDMLENVVSHLGPGGELRRTDVSLVGHSTMIWRNFTLIITEFGSWAHKLGFAIPDEFPRSTGTVAVRVGANSRVFEIPHASTKLVKVLALLESFGGNFDNFPSQTRLKELIREHCYPDNHGKKHWTTEADIAALLRPDARGPDKRVGRRRTRD